MTDTCHGCVHYRTLYETCRELQGLLYCNACEHFWSLKKSTRCPKCKRYTHVTEAAECSDAVPAAGCPGYVPRVEPPKQQSLF